MKLQFLPQTRRLTVSITALSAVILTLWIVAMGSAAPTSFADPIDTSDQPVGDTADTVATTAVYTSFIPIISMPYEQPTLTTTDPANTSTDKVYSWTLSWSQEAQSEGLEYIIQESTDPNFSSINNTFTTSTNSYTVEKAASTTNEYFYRVRINENNTVYSNEVSVISAYYHDFDDNIDGWSIVKEDFDDTQNVLSHHPSGFLKMHVQGRWDFMISSPLVKAPNPPYRITTYVKLDGPGNLNTYGSLFGADWNGDDCPSYYSGYTYSLASCFNFYYRSILLWNWGGPTYQSQFKSIEYHTLDKNAGRGADLTSVQAVATSSPSANEWNLWSWEVYPDGTVNLLAGDRIVHTFNDDTLIMRDEDHRYWGLWASTDEYPGSDPLYDYILVEPIN